MSTKCQYRGLHPCIYGSGGRDRTCDPTHMSEINPVFIGLPMIEKASFQMDRTGSCKRQYLKAVVGSVAIGRRFLEKSPCQRAYNPHYTKPHTALYH